jgi:hypothetical protein
VGKLDAGKSPRQHQFGASIRLRSAIGSRSGLLRKRDTSSAEYGGAGAFPVNRSSSQFINAARRAFDSGA